MKGYRIRSAVPRFEPGSQVRIEDGQLIDRLPAYGVCLYRLEVAAAP